MDKISKNETRPIGIVERAAIIAAACLVPVLLSLAFHRTFDAMHAVEARARRVIVEAAALPAPEFRGFRHQATEGIRHRDPRPLSD